MTRSGGFSLALILLQLAQAPLAAISARADEYNDVCNTSKPDDTGQRDAYCKAAKTAQDAADPGVLILSKFAGAAHELTEALIVNPFDPDAIADAMHLALAMPAPERKKRHAALAAKVHTPNNRPIDRISVPLIEFGRRGGPQRPR